MKTILNLSIVLMLIAGSAGAVDFYKMYKAGEIQTLYIDKEAPKVVPTHLSCEHAAEPKPIIETVKENLQEVRLVPELYSRAPLRIKRRSVTAYIAEPQSQDTEIISSEPVIKEDEAVIVSPPVSTTVNKTRDEMTAADDKKPVRKRKLRASMFSRAPLRAEEFEVLLDSTSTSAIDSSMIR